jgi:hypothetical protein
MRWIAVDGSCSYTSNVGAIRAERTCSCGLEFVPADARAVWRHRTSRHLASRDPGGRQSRSAVRAQQRPDAAISLKADLEQNKNICGPEDLEIGGIMVRIQFASIGRFPFAPSRGARETNSLR